MARASQNTHRVFNDVDFPYRSYGPQLPEDPEFRQGSNVLTSIKTAMERRPGFSAALESVATAFGSSVTIKCIKTWRRWAGSTSGVAGAFITMVNIVDTVNLTSKVYKYQHGTDVSLQLIYTCSGSSKPLRFIEFNNHIGWNHSHSGCARIYDGTNVVSWGITSPASVPTYTISTTSGSLQAYDKYYYRQTFWDNDRGHESSPSDISACTGIFGPGTVNGTAIAPSAADASRVTHYRIYRTPDGGSDDPQLMQEIAGSPFAIGTLTWTDTTADASLGSRLAPAELRNDPPPAMDIGALHAGRIGGFANNIFYYSGNEEIANGVREECWPGGLDGNYRPYSQEINAVAASASGFVIFQANRIDAIDGDRLDAFYFYQVAKQQGCRGQSNVCEFGGIIFWIDTMDTVWMLGGDEVGMFIRNDIAGIDHTQSQLLIHMNELHRWLILLDGGSSQMLVYDLDVQKWMPPWPVSATYLESAEISIGDYTLVGGFAVGKVLKLVDGTYNDNGIPYTAYAITSPFDLYPSGNPEWRGSLKVVNIDVTGTAPTVSRLMDDVVGTGTYTALTRSDAALRTSQGSTLKSYDYNDLDAIGARVSLRFDWIAEDAAFTVEELYLSFEHIGT